MQNTKEKDENFIKVMPAKAGMETFSFELHKGQLKPQQLQVLLEFLFVSRPYHSLKILQHMMVTYMMSNELEEMNLKEVDGLRELLNLLSGLWEAEHGQHDPLDLLFFN